eukprot:gene8245-16961_t
MKRVGFFGGGVVAQSLGRGFLDLGYDVMLGSREQGNVGNRKAVKWARKAGPNAYAGTFSEAAQFSDIVFIATAGTAVTSAIEMAGGNDSLSGKVIVDVTNSIIREKGVLTLSGGFGTSNGEIIQNLLPHSSVVKAFNTVGENMFYKPKVNHPPPSMFICGNDAIAMSIVKDITIEFGWEPIDVGDITMSHYIESMAMVWLTCAIRTGSRHMAFKMLKAPGEE